MSDYGPFFDAWMRGVTQFWTYLANPWQVPTMNVIARAEAEVGFSFEILSESGLGREYANCTELPPLVEMNRTGKGQTFSGGVVLAQGDVSTGLVVDATSMASAEARWRGDRGEAGERLEGTITFYNDPTDAAGPRMEVYFDCTFLATVRASATANPGGPSAAEARFVLRDEENKVIESLTISAMPGRGPASLPPGERHFRVRLPADTRSLSYSFMLRTMTVAGIS